MSRTSRLVPLLIILTPLANACRSKPGNASNKESPQTAPPSGFVRFVDEHFAFDYPSTFDVTTTKSGNDEWLTIAPRVPAGVWTDGKGLVQPDPSHPDMLLDDEVNALAKETLQLGHRVVGGVRHLPTRNGACQGFVAIDPSKPCPANAPFKTPTGICFAATLSTYCKTPSNKRLIYIADLGLIPTADALTPEAAAFGKTHERILSTLEFK